MEFFGFGVGEDCCSSKLTNGCFKKTVSDAPIARVVLFCHIPLEVWALEHVLWYLSRPNVFFSFYFIFPSFVR
jgi:hypothetical protein